MKQFATLSKLAHGDQVAVISPSAGLPGLFPWVHELGIERLQNEFGLVPREYPTTRQMGTSLEDRARDAMAAFADPANKAVISTIGGEDQIRLIKYLEDKVFSDNPKPFFGFSDNTHLHNYLWNLGIPSYYGGGIMNQYAMQGKMHDLTTKFLRRALFDAGEYELAVADEYNDVGHDWADKSLLDAPRKMESNDGLFWDGEGSAEGVLWGGCVESLIVQCTVGKYLPKDADMDGVVLCLETAEDIPDHWVMEYLLTGFGERGWFDRFQAVLVGRPKAWEFNDRRSADEKDTYRQEQRQAVLKTVRSYNTTIPIVQNLDFGHTDPQIAMPFGRRARIDNANRKIYLTY